VKLSSSRTVVDGVMVLVPVQNVTAAADAAGVRRSTLILVVILL